MQAPSERIPVGFEILFPDGNDLEPKRVDIVPDRRGLPVLPVGFCVYAVPERFLIDKLEGGGNAATLIQGPIDAATWSPRKAPDEGYATARADQPNVYDLDYVAVSDWPVFMDACPLRLTARLAWARPGESVRLNGFVLAELPPVGLPSPGGRWY